MSADVDLTRWAEAREACVAAIVSGLGMDPDDVEEYLLPDLDNAIRRTLGHEGWLRWMR